MKHTDESRKYHLNQIVLPMDPKVNKFMAKHFLNSGGGFDLYIGIMTKSNFSCGYMQANLLLYSQMDFKKEWYEELVRLCEVHRKPMIFTAIHSLKTNLEKFIKKENPRYLKKLTETESGHGKYYVGLYIVDMPDLE